MLLLISVYDLTFNQVLAGSVRFKNFPMGICKVTLNLFGNDKYNFKSFFESFWYVEKTFKK